MYNLPTLKRGSYTADFYWEVTVYQVREDLNKFGTVQSNPFKTEINSPTKYILEELILDFSMSGYVI